MARIEIEKKLAEIAKTDTWKIIKRILQETAETYYSWEVKKEDLAKAQGVHEYLDLIIRKIDGAKDALSFRE